jgi:hypothetical protein
MDFALLGPGSGALRMRISEGQWKIFRFAAMVTTLAYRRLTWSFLPAGNRTGQASQSAPPTLHA